MNLTAERAIQRRLTTSFIATDPESIVLLPQTRTENGSGGFTVAQGDPRSSQTMRLIPLTNTTTERLTLDGKMVVPKFMLMAQWDAIVDRWDQFELDGVRYEIVHLQEKRDYQTKAEVVYLRRT